MPIFQELFDSNPNPSEPIMWNGRLVQPIDRLYVADAVPLVVTFEHVGSRFRQAVILKVDGQILVNGELVKKGTILWHDTAPKVVPVVPRIRKAAKDRRILVYNAWDRGNGVTDAWTMGGAMIVEQTPTGRRYHCNDWEPDDDFDDLIFSIDFTPAPE